MNLSLYSIPIFIITTFTVPSKAFYPPEFELIKKGEGISFYERWIIMEDGEESREVKFSIEVNAPLKSVIAVLTKESFGKKWNNNTLDYKIKSTGKDSWISYIKYSFPFPLSNRECYLHNEIEDSNNGHTIYFRSEETRVFSQGEDIPQMKGLKGRWVMFEKKDHTLLRYHIISVPEKGLPRWIVDPIIRRNLWSTMTNLKRTIEEI
jgi:hypothetical protein